MDQRCPKICYQKKEDGLTVTACYGIDGQIYLPDELRGEPITAIAPYAFSDCKYRPDRAHCTAF